MCDRLLEAMQLACPERLRVQVGGASQRRSRWPCGRRCRAMRFRPPCPKPHTGHASAEQHRSQALGTLLHVEPVAWERWLRHELALWQVDARRPRLHPQPQATPHLQKQGVHRLHVARAPHPCRLDATGILYRLLQARRHVMATRTVVTAVLVAVVLFWGTRPDPRRLGGHLLHSMGSGRRATRAAAHE